MKFKEKRKAEGKEKNKEKDKDKDKNKEKNYNMSINHINKNNPEKMDKSDDSVSIGNITNVGSSTNVDSTRNFAGLRRATTNFNALKRTTTKMKNKIELVLFKKKEGKKTNKEVKLLLCGHYIFYYINAVC